MARAEKKGLTFYVGPEIEYFYFKSDKNPEIIDEGSYFELIPNDLADTFFKPNAGPHAVPVFVSTGGCLHLLNNLGGKNLFSLQLTIIDQAKLHSSEISNSRT